MITPTPPEATRPTKETDGIIAKVNRPQGILILANHARQLQRERDEAREQRDALQHIIECANTPLMRDVMAERDALRVALDFMEANPGTVFHTPTPDMSNKNWIVRGLGIKERFLTMGEAIEAARRALAPKCPTK